LCFAPLSLRIRVSLAFSAAQSIARRLHVAERGPGCLTHSSSVEVGARASNNQSIEYLSRGSSPLVVCYVCDNKKGQAQQKKMLLPKDQSIKIEYGTQESERRIWRGWLMPRM